MKNFNLLTGLLLSALVVLSACKKDKDDDDNPPVTNPPTTGNTVVSSNISANTTWTNDNVYQLGGRITVLSGVTLTIEKGTIIKGEAGTGSNATALLVARGGRLIAEGTATEPIIFTSVADEIKPSDLQDGNFESPNLDPNINGLWGGVIILGDAKISASNDNDEDVSEVQIEGIPTSDSNGLYGGNNDSHDGGSLKYISIRHGGTNIGQGNEINGLTLGGCGDQTEVDHIEIVSNQDDGIEWFGGTVDVTNVVSWNCGDDGLDTDQSWGGSCDNFVIVGAAGHIFELDGPEGSYEAGHTFRNGSIKASYTFDGDDYVSGDLINMDNNSIVALENLYFTGIVDGQQINRVEATEGSITFTNIQFDVDGSEVGSHVNGTVPAGVSAGSTPQANISVLGWTWASQAGALSGL